ncbi:hypothetical protein BDB00DRAFT_800436 [Zychaea mexicana]|uniref:uncharacterized protein n=1 Tax=Zychaea mexicana TaxID=64656 RepID=UPI0022FE2AF8|nr:uncharacterized protein BDB00DRAFT_800436 [Zychaea mexicana]KAI9498477.1 hypothetical protein BDB00DRAFT_800436 [Zychaea mexicana]
MKRSSFFFPTTRAKKRALSFFCFLFFTLQFFLPPFKRARVFAIPLFRRNVKKIAVLRLFFLLLRIHIPREPCHGYHDNKCLNYVTMTTTIITLCLDDMSSWQPW